MKIGFVGLGVMGFPMARHLVAAGHDVTVFNRSAAKAERFAREIGGRATQSVEDVAVDRELLVSCVGNDDDVRGVVQAALPWLRPAAILVDHSTTSATVARDLASFATASGRFFVDAPVSGGQAGAEKGTLTIMMGGDAGAIAHASQALLAYGKTLVRVGDSGAGQLTKMCNQLAIAGVVQGLAEAVHFAKRAGLDPVRVFEAISKGAAGSWQMDNRWATMVEGRFDFGFAVDLMRKDLGLVLDEARRNGSSLALAALVDQFYADVQKQGGPRWDTSSLVARLEK